MTNYVKVDVTPDTPEWLEERRKSVGASEVAALMGLSPYMTALDVYKDKLGSPRPFPEELAFYGHESEAIIHKWVERFSGVDVTLEPGFMARSVEHPYLHASFDRVSYKAGLTTWQFKTASQHVDHKWDEGIPTDIRIQVQAEMAVAGTHRAAVVVWIGGRTMRLFWEPRDDRFINEHLIPTVRDFWDANVRAKVPPQPTTLSELNEVYVTQAVEVEANEDALEAVERRAVLLSDIESQQAEADALKLAIGNYMGTADTLTYQGQKVLTFKTQAGRASFDAAALKRDHPDLAAAYTSQGSPFRVMRTIKQKTETQA